MRTALVALCALVFAPLSARADVVSASASSFLVQAEAKIEASPDQVWRALPRIER